MPSKASKPAPDRLDLAQLGDLENYYDDELANVREKLIDDIARIEQENRVIDGRIKEFNRRKQERAHERAPRRSARSSTSCIRGFGTTHRSDSGARWGAKLAGCRKAPGQGRPHKFVRCAARGSSGLGAVATCAMPCSRHRSRPQRGHAWRDRTTTRASSTRSYSDRSL